MMTSWRPPSPRDHVPQQNGSPSGAKACFTGLPGVPQDAFRKSQLVDANGGLHEMAVAVRVFQHANHMGWPLRELLPFGIDTERVCDPESPAVVEAGMHRILNQRRPRDLFDDKAR